MHMPAILRRRRVQPLWEALHRVSLAGMNFGGSADPSSTGERAFLRQWAAARSRAVVIDVGANRGDYVAAVAAACPEAVIHAFEPIPSVFDSLLGRFHGSDSIQCWPIALSDQEAQLQLWWDPAHDSLASSVARAGVPSGRLSQHTATARRLDAWANDNGVVHIDLLKVDVEGHEPAVLRGAEGLLRAGAIDWIQFEFGGTAIDAGFHLRDLLDLLGSGYVVHRLASDGLGRLLRYSERAEIATFHNYIARRVP